MSKELKTARSLGWFVVRPKSPVNNMR